jgi:DNA mismatch repair protein MSH3
VLQERIDAVEEIISTPLQHLHTLRPILRGLPDLAKGLCRIQYGKVYDLSYVLVILLREDVPVHP